jgi:hypothetical protein
VHGHHEAFAGRSGPFDAAAVQHVGVGEDERVASPLLGDLVRRPRRQRDEGVCGRNQHVLLFVVGGAVGMVRIA